MTCVAFDNQRRYLPGHFAQTLDPCGVGYWTWALNVPGHKAGYFAPMSSRRVVLDDTVRPPDNQLCLYAPGSFTVGFGRGLRITYCSMIRDGHKQRKQAHEARITTSPRDDTGIKIGYAAFVGAYRKPRWFEFLVFSKRWVCAGVR